MSDKDNLLQLKKLAVKVVGGDTKIDDIQGETIAEVLDIIQQHFTSGGAGLTIDSAELNVDGAGEINNGLITMSDGSTIPIELKTIEPLTLTSTEGSGISRTKITVTPPIEEGHIYKYKIGTNVVNPAPYQDLSAWLDWNGTDEIEADDGSRLRVAECLSDGRALKCGNVKVNAPLF